MEYLGSLNEKYMSSDVRKAYNAWKNQRRRCNCSSNKSYKTYGGLGIRVEYTSREFIGWYLKALTTSTINQKDVIVGRINHSANYKLDNVHFETKKQSLNEMLTRNNRRKEILVFSEKTGCLLAIADSMTHAARLTGIYQSGVSSALSRRSKCLTERASRSGFIFKERK